MHQFLEKVQVNILDFESPIELNLFKKKKEVINTQSIRLFMGRLCSQHTISHGTC